MMENMVDIHCHMLNEVDDGSYSLENSLEMAALSVESGVSDVICTPHSIPGMFENYAGEALNERFEIFRNALKEEGIPLNVYLGMEVYGNDNTADDLKNRRLCTLAGSRYMLIEFNFGANPQIVNYILEDVADCGYVPVIAHPERYDFVAQRPAILYKWADKGYLMQCNKDSIRGKFGRMIQRIAMDMLSDGLFSFVGSDAHGALHRTPYLEYAFNEVEDQFGTDYAVKLFSENPRKILHNKEILIGV